MKTIHTGGSPACIRAGDGTIWVGSQNGDFIYRINQATNKVTPIKIGHLSELCVDVEPDAVWVSDDAFNSVTRVDPKTNTIVATIKVDGSPADGARGPDGYIWIPNQGADGTISRIDPATNTLVDTITVGGHLFVAGRGSGSLWAGDFAGSVVRRIAP